MTLEHFKAFAQGVLILDSGNPMPIEDFQEQILADFFDGFIETLVLLPSGNGKTTLFAALALYCLLYTRDPAIYIMAASREQAGLMHSQIAGFVDRQPSLARHVTVKRREVDLKRRTGFIRVMASDADTADGIAPTVAFIDELHRHKNDELCAVARKGLKKRGGQMIHCTTAGDTEHSPLGELRKRCLESIPGIRRDDMHSYGRMPDKTLAYHEWALSENDDRNDMTVVKRANPLSTITERALSAEHAGMKWWQWCRFACGLWVQGEHSAISPIDWAACADPDLELDADHGHFITLDLAWVGDTTAIDAVQVITHRDIRTVPIDTIFPPGDGTAMREGDILRPIERWKAKHPNVIGVVMDPEAGGRALVEKLEDLGLDVIEHSQKNEPMSDAAMRMDEAIRNRALAHADDPTVNKQVLSTAAKILDGGRFKFVKRRKNPTQIDHAVSIAMGVRVGQAALEEEPATAPTIEVLY